MLGDTLAPHLDASGALGVHCGTSFGYFGRMLGDILATLQVLLGRTEALHLDTSGASWEAL